MGPIWKLHVTFIVWFLIIKIVFFFFFLSLTLEIIYKYFLRGSKRSYWTLHGPMWSLPSTARKWGEEKKCSSHVGPTLAVAVWARRWKFEQWNFTGKPLNYSKFWTRFLNFSFFNYNIVSFGSFFISFHLDSNIRWNQLLY